MLGELLGDLVRQGVAVAEVEERLDEVVGVTEERVRNLHVVLGQRAQRRATVHEHPEGGRVNLVRKEGEEGREERGCGEDEEGERGAHAGHGHIPQRGRVKAACREEREPVTS